MPIERDVPYIWVTWIASLLSGDNHCEWAAWFRARFRHEKRASRFDEIQWRARHGEMLRSRVASLRQSRYGIFIEAQNKFTLAGRVATVGGTPDIVAVGRDDVWVIDCKTGQPKDSHYFQVLIYMMVLPITHHECHGRTVYGEIQYQDYSVAIMPDQLTEQRKGEIRAAIERIAAKEAPARVPSAFECRGCPVAGRDCPERIDEVPSHEHPEHGLF